MLNLPSSVKIYLGVDPCDLRKSFNGLYGQVVNVLKEDPLDGALFVFTNKRYNRIKILYWDGSGLWVMCKRLEKGGFSWPRGLNEGDGKLHLSNDALGMLLSGVDLKNGLKKCWYER